MFFTNYSLAGSYLIFHSPFFFNDVNNGSIIVYYIVLLWLNGPFPCDKLFLGFRWNIKGLTTIILILLPFKQFLVVILMYE